MASPDPKRGMIVKAFVRVAEGATPDEELVTKIQHHVRDSYAYPREVEFVDDLPKTLTGKIRRIDLRQAEQEKKKKASKPS